MRVKATGRASIALTIALVIAAAPAAAQDTTRRPVSEQRIPVRKDQTFKQESGGEVSLVTERVRINDLELTAAALRQRLESTEMVVDALRGRTAETERMITMLKDSLRLVNAEIFALRDALSREIANNAALSQDIQRLDKRFGALRNGSLFGHSGFYVGVGTGVNITTGTLHSIGYREGLNVVVPIGWSKPGKLFGVRGEFGAQSFEARMVQGFANRDPMLYTAQGLLTLNLPINNAKTNTFYLMGGGGAFIFHRYGKASTLTDRLGNSGPGVTKWGVTGGAGLELHILGATSLFAQTQITNVFADKSNVTTRDDSGNLRWVPLVAGITLR